MERDSNTLMAQSLRALDHSKDSNLAKELNVAKDLRVDDVNVDEDTIIDNNNAMHMISNKHQVLMPKHNIRQLEVSYIC